MKRRLLTVLLGWCIAGTGSAGSLPEPLRDALAQAGVSPSGLGLYVQEVDAHQPLLVHNADRPMSPASTMKLVTTLAGLELLGPNFTWRTEAWTDGTLSGDVLNGNLVLKGYGDPDITLQDFWMFLTDLRARGLREIHGDLVLDRSFFSVDEVDPGGFDNEPTRPYNVIPDALLVNYKSIWLQFLPDEQTGRVRILSTPQFPQVTIINQLALGAGNCDFWPEKPQSMPERATLIFTGVFPRGCGEKSKSFSLLTPNEYLMTLFGQIWRELGGTLSGSAHDGTLPERAALFDTWESPPLSRVIRDINKYSNNVMARHLFLTLSLAADNPPATTEKSKRAVREWLARSGLDFPELTLENGSGLSRVERITPRHMAELLLHAWRSPLMPEYLSSLPIPGVDGTLRRRLTDSDSAGHGHIKTGYLEGVRAIAGYVNDRAGRTFVVVSLVNHPQAIAAQAFQDAVTEWVSSRGLPSTAADDEWPQERAAIR